MKLISSLNFVILLVLTGCVTAPSLDLSTTQVSPSSVKANEVVAFASLLPNELRYVPRSGGMLDLEEIPYQDSEVSIDREAFDAWRFVTESYINSSLTDLTSEVKSMVSQKEGLSHDAIIQNIRREHPDVRYIVLFTKLRPTTIMVGFAPMNVDGPGSINLDTVPLHGPLVNCGVQVLCFDIRSGARVYSHAFGSYEKLSGIEILPDFSSYTDEERQRIMSGIRAGLRKASVGPAKKLAKL
jgi:hypothetical protein